MPTSRAADKEPEAENTHSRESPRNRTKEASEEKRSIDTSLSECKMALRPEGKSWGNTGQCALSISGSPRWDSVLECKEQWPKSDDREACSLWHM